MSEKLKYLWQKSKEYIDNKYPYSNEKTEKYLEKFAELVINECSDLSDNKFYFKKKLREYFGLKL